MRHPFHAICPYFAMFPETFVERQVRAYTVRGDYTFDPFCGRGTTIFQSLLMDRPSAGTDVNAVAACIAGAKASPPQLSEILHRLTELQELYDKPEEVEDMGPFFKACYHPDTLAQVLYLRRSLRWQTDNVDRFVAAMALGALHGEAHRSELYFSNRMPRTISTKPDYSIRWWQERGYVAPRRDTFSILKRLARFRYRLDPAAISGTVTRADARQSSQAFPELRRKVRLVVTSPPYLNTTDYSEDQWLRLWFLGGPPAPVLRQGKDDRLVRAADYWQFLTEAWLGVEPLLSDDAIIVVRIGGKGLTRDDLRSGLEQSLKRSMPQSTVTTLDEGVTTAIKPRETTAFRPNKSSTERVEHDFTFGVCR
jgi:hypothetical protein